MIKGEYILIKFMYLNCIYFYNFMVFRVKLVKILEKGKYKNGGVGREWEGGKVIMEYVYIDLSYVGRRIEGR